MTFRTAFIISFSVHFLALFSGGVFPFNKFDKKSLSEDLEVTYILSERPRERNLDDIKLISGKGDHESETKTAPSVERIKQSQEPSLYLKEEEARQIESYIAYYDILRERIRSEVLKYYGNIDAVGEIDVIFILNPDGALVKLHIDDIKSTPNSTLRELAEKGVREASPFPPFPKALRKSALTFSIPIIFTKE